MALAVIAMIIAHKEGLVNINCVSDCFAETMAGEGHGGRISRKCIYDDNNIDKLFV